MTILYCPVGPQELDLLREANWSRFAPRLPEQPIFYPVLNEEYARQIARYWNVKASGAGFVTKFAVSSDYLKGFDSTWLAVSSMRNTGYPQSSWMSSIRTFWE